MALGNISMGTIAEVMIGNHMLDLSGSRELGVSEQRMKTITHMDGAICGGQHPRLC